ncbi:MAG TPA: CBS domain-containing protein [Chitinophagaceae bacterium]|jgi:CBS domain-containing protein
MKTISDILSSKPKASNSIKPGALVIDALNLLNSVNLSYLIVMDGDNYKGIFCERDYSRNVVLKGRSSSNTSVQDVMTTDLPLVEPSDSIAYGMSLMNSHKTRYLLAYDGKKFAGVITIHDLLRQVLSNLDDSDNSMARTLIDNEEAGRIF